MNERIQELAEQAGFYITIDRSGIFIPDPHTEDITEVTKKFAELIVRECMALCKTSVGNADYNTGRLHCLENIKEHFGVK